MTCFAITVTRDVDRRRLDFLVTGPMDSARFIDEEIAALQACEAPWLYDRLIDLRDCEGHVRYDDIDRLANYWNTVAYQAPRPVRVAVLTRNRLVTARLPLVDGLFSKHHMCAFDDLAAAQAWLDGELK